MIGRWLHGRHPLDGSYGAWLSKPGIDVRTTTDPNNMLISPSAKNEQILMSGVVAVGAGGAVNVFYPEDLSSPAFVQYIISTSGGAIFYPMAYNVYNGNSMIYCTQSTYFCQFLNLTNVTVYFYYTVCARSD
jgi:hypothetical protein